MYKDDFDEKSDKLRFIIDRYNDVIVLNDIKIGRSYALPNSEVDVTTELED